MSRVRPAAAALALALAAAPGGAQAQWRAAGELHAAYHRGDPLREWSVASGPGSRWVGEADRPLVPTSGFITPASPVAGAAPARAPLWAPLASAVVPGLGQAAMGQGRFVAYLAAESYAWLRYATDVAEGRRRRREYQVIARDVARAFFSENRPVGDFEYYEHMKEYDESGVFDLEPGGDLQPETDESTYNGFIWLLARQTFWEDSSVPPEPGSPQEMLAIEFYRRRAIRPEFRWSWRNAGLERNLYNRTIDRSNEAFRRSVADLGFILANHVLSAVDSSISVRLRRRPGPDGGVGVDASLPWAPFGRSGPGRVGGGG